MNDYNSELNRVYRYSTDSINSMLTELQKPEYNQHRWGDDHPLNGLRGVLADAMDDNDRSKEAELLRAPNQHILVREGRVRPAIFERHSFNWQLSQINKALQSMGFAAGLVAVPSDRSPNYSTDKTHLTLLGDADDYPDTHHPSEFGKAASSYIANSLPEGWWETEEGEKLDNHLGKLQRTAYEDVDTSHPSEKHPSN